MTEAGASWGNRGAPLSFFPEGRTYSPPGLRPGGGTAALRQARALRGGCGSCGSLQPMLPRLRSWSSLSARSGSVRRSTPPAKTCTRQFYRRGRPSQKFGLLSLLRKRNRKRKYGGDSDWQYTTWKRRSSAEEQAARLARHRPI